MNQNIANQINNRIENVQRNVNNLANNVNNLGGNINNIEGNVNNLGNNVNNLGGNVNNLGNNVNTLENNVNNIQNNVVVGVNTVENINREILNNGNIVQVVNENYPVDKNSTVPHHERWTDAETPAPPPVPNGGLFGGPQAMGEYASIHVTPTATNLIQNNLRSANPPPGATEQYPGTNRLGNNYVPMPGVYWYSDTHPVNKGPYSMKVTDLTREV